MHQCESIRPGTATDPIWTEWRQLMPQTPEDQRMFGPDWFRIWADTWGSDGHWTGQHSLIAVRDAAGTLQGLLALSRPQRGPFRIHATGGHNVPHRRVIAAEGKEAVVGAAIGNFIAQQNWPLLQIGPIRDDAPACQAMMSQLKQAGIHVQPHDRREEITLHTPDTWEEYRSEVLGSKFARKLGYYERRMQRAGHATLQHYRQPSPEETQTMYAALTAIEAASWMATREDAVLRFTNPSLVRFWEELTIGFLSPEDHLDCWVMSFDGRPVSFCFTLTNGRTRYVIANNYDNAVRDHRTGSTLYRYMIEDGIERGVRRFEFADGDLHYKSLWGARVDGSVETWLAVPNRALGWGAALAGRMRNWIRPSQPVTETENAASESMPTPPAPTPVTSA